jgi:hypothetical protein
MIGFASIEVGIGHTMSNDTGRGRSPIKRPLRIKRDQHPGPIWGQNKNNESRQRHARLRKSPRFDLEAAAGQAIAASGGDTRASIKSIIVANNDLTRELEHAWQLVLPGYSRDVDRRRLLTIARQVGSWRRTG